MIDTTLTFGSLFAGIGGIDLGLERAGMKCLWQVEIDEYANKVLKKHWPNVTRYGDIRTVDFTKAKYVDVIAGGFPCQDISTAGKRKGIKGERSGLWKEFHRAIREIRPRFIVVENVSALCHRGLDTVLADLAASGYDAEWDCIPAAAVGAPHRRDRIFIVAYTQSIRSSEGKQNTTLPSRKRGMGFTGCSQNVADTTLNRCKQMPKRFIDQGCPIRTSMVFQEGQEIFANTNTERLEARILQAATKRSLERYRCTIGKEQWQTEPRVGRVVNGVPDRMDRIKCLGNAVVPQVAEFVAREFILKNPAIRDGE